MDIETAERYGNRRIQHRIGASQAAPDRANNKVCFNWRAGRCNRFPCPYLHSELPQHADGGAKRAAAADERGFRSQGLVWRNSNTNGNSGPPSKWGKGRGGGSAGGVRPQRKPLDKICNYFISGTCSFGESCRFLHSYFLSDSISLLTPLNGHQKVIFITRMKSSSSYCTHVAKCLGAILGLNYGLAFAGRHRNCPSSRVR